MIYLYFLNGSNKWLFEFYLSSEFWVLVEYSKKWRMTFNVTKCNTLIISRAHELLSKYYTLAGHILEEFTEDKYLGVTISNDLIWSTHISITIRKGNVIMDFHHRNLTSRPPKTKEMANIALVQLALEYSAPHMGLIFKERYFWYRKSTDCRAALFVRRNHHITSIDHAVRYSTFNTQ